MTLIDRVNQTKCLARAVLVACAVILYTQAQAQVTLVSTVPANGATGVSRTAPVVFTFSAAMNAGITRVLFMDALTAMPLPAVNSWNGAQTVLTCTPIQPFPAGKAIVWTLSGAGLSGGTLNEGGYFNTATSGTQTGTCSPNEGTAFTLGKGYMFVQTSSGASTPNTNAPYAFVACTTVACSNASASSVTLTKPNSATVDIAAVTGIPGHFNFTGIAGDQTTLEGSYPNGNYTFNIQGTPANQQIPLTFPSSLVSPNAPHVANFTAAQSIDAAQNFTLTWDAFQGGTTADTIYVEIYGGVYATPALGSPGALNGMATSTVIPAGTLQPGSNYMGAVTFYDAVLNTNALGYLTLVYRASSTEFGIRTASAVTGPISITNAVVTGRLLTFEVTSSPGQTIVLESCSNLRSGGWQPVLTTNSPGRIRFTDPREATQSSAFYRVRTGP